MLLDHEREVLSRVAFGSRFGPDIADAVQILADLVVNPPEKRTDQQAYFWLGAEADNG